MPRLDLSPEQIAENRFAASPKRTAPTRRTRHIFVLLAIVPAM
jgi:hypothetical protein